MSNDIELAIRQICEEKGLSYEAVIETIETALSAAYRKDYGHKMQNIEANFDPKTGGVRLFDVKTVVEDISDEELEAIQQKQAEEDAERKARNAGEGFRHYENPIEDDLAAGLDDGPKFNPKTDIMIRDARVLKMSSQIGDVMKTELILPGEFGRMAAMTAKQVITQKLREAEREIVFGEFKEQEGEVLIGTVQRREGRMILVDLGRGVGVILPEDQIPREAYNSGDRLKVYVREVSLGARGPQILLTRAGAELVRSLFEIEIPEVAEGTVEIKGIAREPGARTKIAVHSADENIDPVGACIGQRGSRIQTIINELAGEKIDVIEWSANREDFLRSALAPAKVESFDFDEQNGLAIAVVDEGQLSLAIGRGGQNVRLAARLTGWKLSVKGNGVLSEGEAKEKIEEVVSEAVVEDKPENELSLDALAESEEVKEEAPVAEDNE
jgi:N utilization substance protein A